MKTPKPTAVNNRSNEVGSCAYFDNINGLNDTLLMEFTQAKHTKTTTTRKYVH